MVTFTEINERDSRTAALLGADSLEKLKNSRVAVFGIGGVGGYICEALARAGVGALDLFDKDIVSESNINRQIIATYKTLGMPKVTAMADRIREINPDCLVREHNVFYLPEVADGYPITDYDYIADAVDTVTAKLEIILRAKAANIPVISAMGAGNKLYPEKFEVADIFSTSVCPLAKVMRKKLKELGIDSLKVVYSREEVRESALPRDPESGKIPPASISFVPSVMGLIMAGEIIRDITGQR